MTRRSAICGSGTPVVVKADGWRPERRDRLRNRKRGSEALTGHGQARVRDAGTRWSSRNAPGEEASFLAFTDGKTVLAMPSSQDHKAIYDEDRVPTPGHGRLFAGAGGRPAHPQAIMNEIMIPRSRPWRRGRPYQGVLYAG